MTRLALVDASYRVFEYVTVLSRLVDVCVSAVVEDDLQTAELAAQQLGADVAVSSLDQLLGENIQAFDAAVIHSPLPLRTEAVRRIADAGKHVLVDAPLGISTDEAVHVTQFCQSLGVCCMTAQWLRYMPFQQTVHGSLQAGKLGDPGLLRIHHWRTKALDDLPAGKAMMEFLVEESDLACWLFAADPDTVYAAGHSDTSAPYVQVHLGFPAGGMALIDCACQAGTDPYFSLSLIGAAGAAYADDHRNINLLFRDHPTTAVNVGQGGDHRRLQLAAFAKALRANGGGDSVCSGNDAIRAIRVAEAASQSLTTGRVVRRVGEEFGVAQ